MGLDPAHCLHKYPHQLSGGQLQRLLMARALILDIRFSGRRRGHQHARRIDPDRGAQPAGRPKAGGLSILFITHDLSLGYYLSERTLILYRGRVVEMGDTEKVFGDPQHPYTRMLLASMPRLDRKWADADESFSGDDWAADGYVYHGRRARAMGDSGSDVHPDLVELEPGHLVARFE